MVTTPESLQLLLGGRRLREALKSVKWIIADEVREIAGSKRGAQLSTLMERLKELTGAVQIIGLPATVGNPEEVAKLLVGEEGCEIVYTPVAKRIEVRVLWPDPGEGRRLADELMVTADVAARLKLIRELMDENRTTLLFSSIRPTVEFLGSRLMLWDEDYPIYVRARIS